MNTFETCKNVRNVVLNRAAQVMVYPKWNAEFAQSEMTGLAASMKEKADWFAPINANDLTEAELIELGFSCWSEETSIRLIPLWIMPFLKEEIDAQCIDGQKVTKVSEMDNDARFGCIAYGVIPKAP